MIRTFEIYTNLIRSRAIVQKAPKLVWGSRTEQNRSTDVPCGIDKGLVLTYVCQTVMSPPYRIRLFNYRRVRCIFGFHYQEVLYRKKSMKESRKLMCCTYRKHYLTHNMCEDKVKLNLHRQEERFYVRKGLK